MDLREAKEAFDEFREKIEIYPGYEEFDFSEFDQKRYLYGVKITFIILARALGVTTDLIPVGSNDFTVSKICQVKLLKLYPMR